MIAGWSRGSTIGRGSSATVSIAIAHNSGAIFAVKSAHLADSARLRREHSILSSLSSPYVVGCLGADVSLEGGSCFYNLFMEYFPGGTLCDEIRRWGGRIPEPEIRRHGRSVLEGLHYLHGMGIVHCDIKGTNLLVGKDGEVRIGDLGCAVWEDRGSKVAELAGTPLFMAPEVARGQSQRSPADVWALGCTVVEMATGRPPWPEVSDPVSAIYKIGFTGEMPELPVELSEEGKDFLRRCFCLDPAERWTAEQLRRHPFMNEFKGLVPDGNPFFDSPKSILDGGLWDSLGNGSTQAGSEIWSPSVVQSQSSPDAAAAERIRPLFSPATRQPTWSWEENWVHVRSNAPENPMVLETMEVEDSQEASIAGDLVREVHDCEFVVAEISAAPVNDDDVGVVDEADDQFCIGRRTFTTIDSIDYVNEDQVNLRNAKPVDKVPGQGMESVWAWPKPCRVLAFKSSEAAITTTTKGKDSFSCGISMAQPIQWFFWR